MVTTVSEDFYKSLQPTPDLKQLDDMDLRGPDGGRLPYVGYVEATVEIPFVDCSDLLVPVLVVPTNGIQL